MTWLIFALIGHTANGAAFIIDKALLSTAFKRSATYAGLVGLLSLLVLVAIPWAGTLPGGGTALLAAISGATFVLALYAFFESLARSEASRVVPIVGSLIPLLTLGGTAVFLHEQLRMNQGAGFICLIGATILLSSGGRKSRPRLSTTLIAIGSALLFAVSSVSGKLVYDAAGFLPGFIETRAAAGITALVLVTLIDRAAGRELRSMISSRGSGSDTQRTKRRSSSAILAIIGQSLGAIGFVFVQYAISIGSAALTNALQAIQYVLITLVAWILRKRAPKLLGERFTPRIIALKAFAFLLVTVGLVLIV